MFPREESSLPTEDADTEKVRLGVGGDWKSSGMKRRITFPEQGEVCSTNK